jgi:anti-sigma B factor antagonist
MNAGELRTRVFHGYAVVVLCGELDTTGAEATADAVAALAAGGQQLIIDLEALHFIDCHAFGALLGVRKMAQQKGGDVLLAAPRGPVLPLLTVLGVAGVYTSVAAAADSAGRRAARRIARFRAVPAGAWYWWAVRTAPVPGARAGGLPWSPRRARARSGPRG